MAGVNRTPEEWAEWTEFQMDIARAGLEASMNAEFMLATLIGLLIDKGVVTAAEVTGRYEALSGDFLPNPCAHLGAVSVERLLGLIRQKHPDGTKAS